MVLAEISNNISARARAIGSSTRSSSNGTCLTSQFRAERKADCKHPPSSLQGMLKNTTEIGDIRPFSIKPTRIPYPTTRRASQRRKASDNPASPSSRTIFQRHSERQHKSEHVSGEYIPFRPYVGTTASSVISLYEGESQKSLDRLSENASQDYQSYPVMQSFRTSHRWHDQRSLASLQSQRDQTRSPLAYPTRLKRPGYRPSSPALSDFNRSEARMNFGLNRGTSFRTSSPLSVHTKDRMTSTHHRGFSRSIPSLVNPPSAFIPRLDRAHRKAPAPRRVQTPTPLSKQSARVATQDWWARSVPTPPTSSRPSPSATPLYYDYTEAFEEETHFRNTTMSTDSLVDYPILEDRVHDENDAKVDNDPIELPVSGSASPDSSVGSMYSASGVIPVEGSGGMPIQALENHEVEPSPSTQGCLSDNRSQQLTSSDDVNEDESEEGRPALSELSKYDEPVGCSSFSKDPCAGGVSSPTSSHTARGMVGSDSFLRSPHPSCLATDALEYYFSKAEGADKEHPSTEDVSQVQWKPPSLDFSHLDLHDKTTCRPGSYRRRVLSSDGLVETDYAGIYAPVPERTLSARSHQNKYSRILSIDENFTELVEVVEKSEVADTRYAQDQTGEEGRSAQAALDQELSSSIQGLSELASQSSVATDSHPSTNSMNLPDRDEDQQRVLSELIRQSLLWQDSHSTAGSRRTENSDDDTVPQDLLQDSFSEGPTGNLTQKSPAPIRNPNIATAHDKILASEHDGRLGLVKTPSHAEFMKKLPSLPRNSSFRSFMPPDPSRSTQLPCAFSPLVLGRDNAALNANMEPSLGALTEQDGHSDKEEASVAPRYRLKMRPNTASTASPADCRPWNLDASYPWSSQPSQVDLRLPGPSRLYQQPIRKTPRFRLKITRASLLNEGTLRVKREAASPETKKTQQAPKPIDLFRSLTFGRRAKSRVSEMGTNGNGSLSKKTRIGEAVEGCLSISGNSSLTPSLPALQFSEARSFFSDDSSQKLRKGSLRKRLSYLKAIATRNSSSEEGKGVDRGLAGSAVGKSVISGRSSEHSTGATVGMSNLKYVRWKMVEKIKIWWHRGEEKIRALGGMVKGKGKRGHPRNTDLYQGV